MNNTKARIVRSHNGVIVPNSVYVTLGGGLGDVFYVYSRGENGWGYIKSLKEKFPFVKITALCSTHNPQTVEFIKYNPHIDEYKEFGWVNDAKSLFEKNSNGAKRLDKEGKALKALNFARPNVYTTDEDKEIIREIESAGNFVLIHPFAGEPGRIAMPIEEWKPLVDEIIEKNDLNVVVIGGKYKRTNRRTKEDKDETFEYERNRLFNLVGKSNARICMRLASEQKHFVGNWSAYSCASWVNNKPTTVIVTKQTSINLENKMKPGKRWRNAKCRIIRTNGPSRDPRNTDYNKVREQIIESITK